MSTLILCCILTVYRAPSLFVQYTSGILELKPNSDEVCKKNEESSTTDDSMLTLLTPKILGQISFHMICKL